MKTSRIKFNLILIAFSIIFVVITLVGNVFHANIKVATIPGSYADTYSKENKLDIVELTDDEAKYFDIRFEDFDYNIADDGTVTIENYKGISSDLVIPEYIGKKKVCALGEKFIETATTVTNLYIPSTLKSIDSEPTSKITIHCYDNTEFNRINGGEDSKWNIELMYDSDYVNFNLGDLDYRYNDKGGYVELVGYSGESKLLIIPSYINGKPVSDVTFDMLGKVDLVVFPDTVTSITGMTKITTVSNIWALAMLFVAIALITTLITINIVLPRLSNLDEIVIATPAVIVTFIYLIAQIAYSLLIIYKGIGGIAQTTIVGLVMFAVYILFIASANRGRDHAKTVEEHIEEDTVWMRELKASAKGMSDGISDPNIRREVKRLEEDILTMPLKRGYDIAEIQYCKELILSFEFTENTQTIVGNIADIRKKLSL